MKKNEELSWKHANLTPKKSQATADLPSLRQNRFPERVRELETVEAVEAVEAVGCCRRRGAVRTAGAGFKKPTIQEPTLQELVFDSVLSLFVLVSVCRLCSCSEAVR